MVVAYCYLELADELRGACRMNMSTGEPSRALLAARVRQLLSDVAVVKDALDRFQPELRRRVEIRLGTAIARRWHDIQELSEAVDAGKEYEADLWASWHALSAEVDVLVEESLVLLHGSALRQSRGPGKPGLDDGYCTLADALIDELVARTPVGCWSSFTVLGRSEQFSLMTQAITVRYPGASLWELPAVAHELGHFAGPLLVQEHGLRLEHPLQTLSDAVGNGDTRIGWWLHELFADVFAAYLIGPAYGFTSVMLGFDPLRAYLPDRTHPCPMVRVHAIASTLRALEGAGMGWAADEVKRLWTKLVDASEASPSPAAGDVLDHLVPQLLEMLTACLPVSGYAGWVEAQHLASKLSGDGDAVPGPSTTLADVLNAAWLARLTAPTPGAVDKIEERAKAACQGLIGGIGLCQEPCCNCGCRPWSATCRRHRTPPGGRTT
jgi:hypothetical protein